MWTGKKPILNHLQIWGCPAEARPYRPNENKLDSRTVSCYFIGYSERSRGFKFYDPTTKGIFETSNARFFEEVEFVRGDKVRDFVLEEEYVTIPQVVIDVNQEATLDQDNVPSIQIQEIVPEEQTQQLQEPIPFRRSTRERRNAILGDYVVYLQEYEYDIGMVEDDPINFHQFIQSSNSQK